MSISRDTIISTLRETLETDPRVLAAWLEGADATATVDAFSDIDFECSVQAGSAGAVTGRARGALERLGRLDIADIGPEEEGSLSAVFHLEDTSPYLLIDFNAYVGRGSHFIAGDAIEKPLILFDRAGVITFSDPADRLAALNPAKRLKELEITVAQYSRTEKYILRGDFLEAFGYYHKWLLTPLVEALRMRYTPLHPDYYIVHISRHLPADVIRRLEGLFQIRSLDDLAKKSREAREWFAETAREISAINE